MSYGSLLITLKDSKSHALSRIKHAQQQTEWPPQHANGMGVDVLDGWDILHYPAFSYTISSVAYLKSNAWFTDNAYLIRLNTNFTAELDGRSGKPVYI